MLEIWSYIADDRVASADGFIDKLNETMQKLGGRPKLGRRRNELAPGVRSFAFGRYVIFYRFARSAVEIVRVLHGARDIENIFEREENCRKLQNPHP